MATFAPTLWISPSQPRVMAGGQVSLGASGGSGSGYVFSFQKNNSGGSIVGSLYSAGSQIWVTDTVQVTDGLGNVATRDIPVVDGAASLKQMRDECKQRTDLVNSDFITDPEWNNMLNKSGQMLYDLVLSAYGNDYNVSPPYPFQSDGILQRYPLPPDFYKLRGLDVQISNSTSGWLSVPKFNFAERNKFMVPYQLFYGVRTNLHYRLVGDKLWLIPIAAGGQFFQLWYVPFFTRLVLDTDVINGLNGWEEFVIADTCVKACAKRETDPAEYKAELAIMADRLQVIADERDLGSPSTVVDVRSQEWEDDPSRNGGQF